MTDLKPEVCGIERQPESIPLSGNGVGPFYGWVASPWISRLDALCRVWVSYGLNGEFLVVVIYSLHTGPYRMAWTGTTRAVNLHATASRRIFDYSSAVGRPSTTVFYIRESVFLCREPLGPCM